MLQVGSSLMENRRRKTFPSQLTFISCETTALGFCESQRERYFDQHVSFTISVFVATEWYKSFMSSFQFNTWAYHRDSGKEFGNTLQKGSNN